MLLISSIKCTNYINNFKHMSSNEDKLVSNDKNEVGYNAKSKKFKTKQKKYRKLNYLPIYIGNCFLIIFSNFYILENKLKFGMIMGKYTKIIMNDVYLTNVKILVDKNM